MQLNSVVLPAPLGPISAVISRARAVKLRSLTATRPPKRMVRCSTVSSGAAVTLVGDSNIRIPLRHAVLRMLESKGPLARHKCYWSFGFDIRFADLRLGVANVKSAPL